MKTTLACCCASGTWLMPSTHMRSVSSPRCKRRFLRSCAHMHTTRGVRVCNSLLFGEGMRATPVATGRPHAILVVAALMPSIARLVQVLVESLETTFCGATWRLSYLSRSFMAVPRHSRCAVSDLASEASSAIVRQSARECTTSLERENQSIQESGEIERGRVCLCSSVCRAVLSAYATRAIARSLARRPPSRKAVVLSRRPWQVLVAVVVSASFACSRARDCNSVMLFASVIVG